MTARQRRHPVAAAPPPLVLLPRDLWAPEPHWTELALCAQTDPDSFFPEQGGDTRPAKKVCMACEVRTQCLDYALDNDERFGIWGGLSERQRRKLRRASTEVAA
ncbi:WhiB family transcriptional regulator [Spirillospora sp. NPDC048911]|uniref:WhiB family transcriptional regulator n=1 Tax=Spirillospora sp. NPDC048911 TaxID=3364527 RepID=UPI003712385E